MPLRARCSDVQDLNRAQYVVHAVDATQGVEFAAAHRATVLKAPNIQFSAILDFSGAQVECQDLIVSIDGQTPSHDVDLCILVLSQSAVD
mmetsp:Transcript_21719/g.29140  ORF Transcript_21719/g.29140 Transcript_21719/m.29140 type:complete len:90 (+) Transcript_21719:91-360(+)